MGVEQCGTIAISPLGTQDRALNKLQDADTAAVGKLRELNFTTQRNKYCFAKSCIRKILNQSTSAPTCLNAHVYLTFPTSKLYHTS